MLMNTFSLNIRRGIRLIAVCGIGLTLHISARAQIQYSLGWSGRTLYQQFPDRLITTSLYTVSLALAIERSPFSNVRVEDPFGRTSAYTYVADTHSTSGGSVPGSSQPPPYPKNEDELRAALTNPWKLITNFGLADARTYTFSINLKPSFDLEAFTLLEPSTFSGIAGTTRVAWSGPVNLAPMSISYSVASGTNTPIILPSGSTEWTGVLPANLRSFTLQQALFNLDYADVTTPVDANGNPLGLPTVGGGFFSLWEDRGERASQSLNWVTINPVSAAVPEPSSLLAGLLIALSASVIGFRRFQQRG
jgi:hypothetical protein